MLRKLSYIKHMRWLCLCLLISLPALLAESAQTSTNTLSENGISTHTLTLTTEQIRQQVSTEITLQKTNEFTNWLRFAAVPDAINLIHGLMTDTQMQTVQREAILLRLTQHLRTIKPSTANRAVMLELTQYQSQILTQHHDDPRHTQAAFNIAASAQGALNEWQFQDINDSLNSRNITQTWDVANDQQQGYILSGLRNGYLDQAIANDIHNMLMQQQQNYPDLAMASALSVNDLPTMLSQAANVSTASALSLLKNIASTESLLNLADQLDLLQAISQHPDPVISGLAMQALAQQSSNTEMTERLIAQLSDPLKGANAAMTLAQIMTDQQIQQLSLQADINNSMLQARIKLIQQLHGELQ